MSGNITEPVQSCILLPSVGVGCRPSERIHGVYFGFVRFRPALLRGRSLGIRIYLRFEVCTAVVWGKCMILRVTAFT